MLKFGLYLQIYHPNEMKEIVENSKYTCSYRRKSCPIYYSETSMTLDKDIKEFIETWREFGEEKAHNWLDNKRSK